MSLSPSLHTFPSLASLSFFLFLWRKYLLELPPSSYLGHPSAGSSGVTHHIQGSISFKRWHTYMLQIFVMYSRDVSTRCLELRAEEPNPEVTNIHRRSGHLEGGCGKRKEMAHALTCPGQLGCYALGCTQGTGGRFQMSWNTEDALVVGCRVVLSFNKRVARSQTASGTLYLANKSLI